jgi:hypothetical protein
MAKLNTPCTSTLLMVYVGYILHVHTAGGVDGYTLHVHTAGGVDGYTLHLHKAGGVYGYTL